LGGPLLLSPKGLEGPLLSPKGLEGSLLSTKGLLV